jgi:hypothetical protein
VTYPDPLDAALAVAAALDGLGVRYVIGGSIASALHGEPRRVELRDSPPASALVASAEDTILQKLVCFRAGGGVSDRQGRDVVGILKCTAGLERGYLQRWARELDLQELLGRAAREAGCELD